MTDYNRERVRELTARMELLTPGPWFWRISSRGAVELAAAHGGGTIVMDFTRKGMQAAEPRFGVCLDGEPRGCRGGILLTTSELIERSADGLLEHPDAELLGDAWELAALLRAADDEMATLRAEVEALRKDADRWKALEHLWFIGRVELTTNQLGHFEVIVEPAEGRDFAYEGLDQADTVDAVVAALAQSKEANNG